VNLASRNKIAPVGVPGACKPLRTAVVVGRFNNRYRSDIEIVTGPGCDLE